MSFELYIFLFYDAHGGVHFSFCVNFLYIGQPCHQDILFSKMVSKEQQSNSRT